MLLLVPVPLQAQQRSEGNDDAGPKAATPYFVPVPVVGVNPALGTILGAGVSLSYYFGEPSTTRVSNMLAGIAYTTKGQLINTYKSLAYLKDDSWVLLGDWRYLNTSQPTYGLGTGPDSAKLVVSGQPFEYDDNVFNGPIADSQVMAFKYVRFYETALMRVSDAIYAGVGYHLDYYYGIGDELLDLDEGIVTSHYAYSTTHGLDTDDSIMSGVSLNAMYDTRDNAINAYSGRYALASLRVNPVFLGSEASSTNLWLEYRDYFDLAGDTKNILAVWAYGSFNTSGDLPYMGLAATSYDQFAKSGRGYVQGRFRGEHMVYLEVELRRYFTTVFGLPFGGVLFANAQTLSADGNDIGLFQYIEPGGGLGLRLMLQRATRTNIAVDYGFGNYSSSGLYIRLNETF